ncbi:MAG TPA: MBOAT family O-acyltransferase, partial [Flavobacterium sp.]|nr:MBOAT family O-acyltransferase [Flavobacterium sp.]
AGPIERATHLLPQIQRKREFNAEKAIDGLRQILWGLFKKLVIADNCAEYANMVFNNSADHSGSTHLIGVLFFTFQIYGDFSGYSDIALGTARLFGIDLLRNFAFPFFSRDTAEYWRRWHISLSSWFKDYLYIPLGGSKGGTWMKVRNTFIIFTVSGFWHGANWTYIIWGMLNALYIIPSIIFNTNRHNLEIVAQGRIFPTAKEVFHILATFSLTVFAFIIFRSNTMADSFEYMSRIASPSFFTKPFGIKNELVWLLIGFIMVEWLGRENQYALEKFGLKWPKPLRLGFYYLILLLIFLYAGSSQEFIYFQF